MNRPWIGVEGQPGKHYIAKEFQHGGGYVCPCCGAFSLKGVTPNFCGWCLRFGHGENFVPPVSIHEAWTGAEVAEVP